jgi:1-acyl-sn-glycerol-3-phosphate acyltransferase
LITYLFTLFFKLKGFRTTETIPSHIKKCVVIAAPHTSNWDFVYAIAAINLFGIKLNYLIKKELFKWPLSIYLNKTGGIAVERSKSNNFVENTIKLFNERENIILVIPPEGTRAKVTKWKSGFYHIAIGANVPLFLGYIDYKEKTAGFGSEVKLTGNKELDIKMIKEFYQSKNAKYPEKFSIESIDF